MKSTSIPRFLLPQGGYFALRRVAHLPPSASWKLQQCLNASTDASPSKPRVLEKPTKFNPPSHSQRLVKRRMPRQYPGPPLSDGQIKEQTTKKYPNMGPPEGTFMHWFLNSPLLHMCITLTVLFSLAITVFVKDFHQSTPFIDMLPPGREFWSHPFKFLGTYGHVYRLHTDFVTAQTAERRKKKVDDVQKRSRYRKAHGMEDEQGFGGWTAKTDDQLLGPAIPGSSGPTDAPAADDDNSSPTDPKPKRRPVKRWLGIWE